MQEFITVKRAAEILECTPHYVRKIIKDGKINGQQIENSNRWQILYESLQQFRKTQVFKQDLNDMRKPQTTTIKEVVENVEEIFEGDVISYIMNPNQGAIIEANDAIHLNNLLSTMDANYKSNTGKKFRKIILILHSWGGFLEAAVKLAGIIKNYSDEFVVIVPLAAKSAATIIALRANKLYLTPVAELGPVDPLVQSLTNPSLRVPAHSIKQFIKQYSSEEKNPFFDVLLKGISDPFILCAYEAAQIFAESEFVESLKNYSLSVEQKLKAKELFLKKESHSYPILLDNLRELGIGQAVKDGAEQVSVNLLMSTYINFMESHNIIKLIGNRDNNNIIFLPTNLVKQKAIQTGN